MGWWSSVRDAAIDVVSGESVRSDPRNIIDPANPLGEALTGVNMNPLQGVGDSNDFFEKPWTDRTMSELEDMFNGKYKTEDFTNPGSAFWNPAGQIADPGNFLDKESVQGYIDGNPEMRDVISALVAGGVAASAFSGAGTAAEAAAAEGSASAGTSGVSAGSEAMGAALAESAPAAAAESVLAAGGTTAAAEAAAVSAGGIKAADAALLVSGLASAGGSVYAANRADAAADAQVDALKYASNLTREAGLEASQYVKESLDPAKQELTTGAETATNLLTEGRDLATEQLTSNTELARQAAQQALTQGTDTLNAAQVSALEAIATSSTTARQDINTSTDLARTALNTGIAQGVGEVEQYAATGEQALQQEAALSGVLGAEAQAAAFQAFEESPGQAYLRQRQEEALLRSSAAIGGLGGGNVRTALQEQAYGIASTDQQRVLENLRSLATRGQSAATTQSGLQAQGGLSGSALETSAGTQLANIALNQGTQESNLISQLQSAIASGQIQVGQQDAQMLEQLGINVGNLTNQTTTNQANIASQLGSGLSGITQQGATTLANIATGQGTQLSNLASNIGSAQAAGIVGTANAYQQGIQNLTGLAGAYYGAQ